MSEGYGKEIKKNQSRGITPERRKRINRLKKIIMYTVLFMILLPTAGSIVLGIKLYQAKSDAETMAAQVDFLEKALQDSIDAADRAEALLKINEGIWKGADAERPSEILRESEEIPVAEEGRKVYLTFDDGPSIYTEELLDILARYNVKATFFVTGKGKGSYRDTYRRIVAEGHTLGMHSYSHEYDNIYASLENFENDVETLRRFLYNETGVVSRFYRFPGGSSNQVSKTNLREMTAYLDAMEIRYFDWNVSSGDAVSVPVGSKQIVENTMRQISAHRVAVVLMHDAADKRSTLEAIPELIESIQELDNTEILPITEETMLIQHAAKG